MNVSITQQPDGTWQILIRDSTSRQSFQKTLAYNSSRVDGQTASTQAQASWAGDGWSTGDSFVEQSFVSCSDKPEGSASPVSSGDMCYDGPVLTMSLNSSR